MPISVRLEPSLETRLNDVSEKLHLNKSEIIKRSLEVFLEQYEPRPSSYELGKDLFGADTTKGETVAANYKTLLKEKLRAKYSR
jgi:predicted transcriptional regulator